MKLPHKTCTIISSVILGLASLCITTSLRAEVSVYIIARGDTLWSIAKENLKNPHNWQQLMEYNNISDASQLEVGQALRIPTEWMKDFSGRVADMAASPNDLPPAALTRKANTVAALYGQAERLSREQREKLMVDATLGFGSRLSTGLNSSANILLRDGSMLVMLADTELVLDDPFELVRGAIELTVKNNKDKPRVITAAGSINAAQARVRVIANDKHMQIEVPQGAVTVTSGGKQRALTTGLAMRVEAGKAMPEPRQGLLRPDLSNLPKSSVNGEINLTWSEITDAAGYRAQLVYAKDTYLVLHDQKLNQASLAWKNISPGRYIVRLRSIDDTGLEGLDAELSYTVLATIQAPRSNSPQEGVTLPSNKPWIAWSRVAEANSYILHVARDAEFKTELQEHTYLINNYYRYDEALPAGEYFWRVKSVSPKGVKSPFGEVRMFKVKP